MRSARLGKVASNTAWILGERAATLVISLFTQVWTARHLGIGDFGTLSYALAFVGIFGAFSYMGFTGIATRDLVRHPGDHDGILGSAFVAKLIGSFIAVGLVSASIFVDAIGKASWPTAMAAAVFLPFESFSVVSYWYQSRVLARPVVMVTACSSVLISAVKVGLIVFELPIVWFGAASGAQGLLTAAGLMTIYRLSGRSPFNWKPSLARIWSLLGQSWPLALSAVVASVYLKIDQVMLGAMTDAESVATYAVAARLSEIWYIVPAAIATSVFPSIVAERTNGAPIYAAKMIRLYRASFVLALLIAGVISLISPLAIGALYGSSYSQSGTILSIHIWACPAIFMGAIFTKWLIAEGFTTFALTRDIAGAALNITLNLVFIPRWGGVGAAVATVISYTVSAYACAFADKRTRPAGIQMTRAMMMLPRLTAKGAGR